jgi:hypothetical protein
MSQNNSSEESLDRYIRFYELFRSYVRHEDNLINNRLTWILTIHGFLYATYGFTLQKELEVIGALRSPAAPFICYSLFQAQMFLLCIAVVGLSISFFGWRSIRAAKRAAVSVDAVFRKNTTIQTNERIARTETAHWIDPPSWSEDTHIHVISGIYKVPAILGGGHPYSVNVGVSASITIPSILLSSWVISLLVLWGVWRNNSGLLCFPYLW